MPSAQHIQSFPDAKKYLSVSKYLQDVYQFRKNENSGFTYDSWSLELGYKSRSYIKMITTEERKVNESFVNNFSIHHSLRPDQKNHLLLVAKYNQISSESEKKIYLDKIFENLGASKEQIEISNYSEFLTTPVLPKILVLLSFKDLDRSVDGLSTFLNIENSDMKNYVQRLSDMGLAEVKLDTEKNKNIYVSTNKSFKVPASQGNEFLTSYHNASLAEAIAAQSLPTDLRRYRSTLLALSKSDYENLIIDINNLISKAVSKYDSDQLRGKRLYKMNVNIFSTTDEYK